MQKVLYSFKYAIQGLKYCFCTQRNMGIHAIVGIMVILLAFTLRISLTGMLFLLTAITFVMVTEILNTALEKAIDLFTSERNHLAHKAKDIAAGAVLLSSLFAVVIGLCILGPPLWDMLSQLLLFPGLR